MNKITVTAYKVIKNEDDTTSLIEMTAVASSQYAAEKVKEEWIKLGYCNITVRYIKNLFCS